MRKLALAAISAAVLFYPMSASAGGIVHRQIRQETRIQTGVQNGTIDRQEYRNLQRRERSVAVQRYRDVRDGRGLTHREKKHLNERLDRISHDIYRDKRD